jgi:hypothetical protein
LYACNTAVRLSTKAALFHRCFSTQITERSQKNKAALSTKMPRSVPGFIVRVQYSRTAFDKGGFISPLFSTQNNREVTKKKSRSFDKKSRDPFQA